jgi:hypothetical protein
LSDFPPSSLEAFLISCAGEWIALRSQFDLLDAAVEDDAWHDSERGEMKVDYLAPSSHDAPGGLRVTAPNGTVTTLTLLADGQALFAPSERETTAGTWTFWPDGSLELGRPADDGQVSERIWFAKPNLRLRSSIAQRLDGEPGRASFSTEIRRISRPPSPAL